MIGFIDVVYWTLKREFLINERSDENLDFWMEAEKYRKASAQEVKPIAKYILQNFIQVITHNL